MVSSSHDLCFPAFIECLTNNVTRSRFLVAVCLGKTVFSFGKVVYLGSSCYFFNQEAVRKFKKTKWPIKSSADGSRLNPSSINNSNGTRLFRAIEAVQIRLQERIQSLRKDLPVKFLFFLVGFYCATAFSTFIGQTGDWDILSAGLAVVVVEAIGALMYKVSLPLVQKAKNVITLFNYWKAGLALGLFMDSFKY